MLTKRDELVLHLLNWLIQLLHGRVKKPSYVDEIHEGDKTISDDGIISEAFNEFFINIGPKLAAESTKQSSK